jgi:Mn2+/Fe2+ NRAMP family transporter
MRRGLRLTVHGRSVRLRGLRLPASGPLRWLLILGPGLIAAAAGNDAGGVATYSAAGAQFGYQLIWVMVIITISLAVVQEMCARLGAATGRGLLDLIRERFGMGWALFAVVIVLLANAGLVVTEFVGVGAAADLLGLSRWVAVPVAALVLWYLVIYGSYGSVEKIFLVMTLVFFAYPVAAILAHPDWGALAHGALVPTVHFDQAYLVVLVGLLGTTITPYMQLFEQSSIVERGVTRRHYGPERVDAAAGAIFSNLMSVAMIVATAATLYTHGATVLQSAADAAKALEPVAGSAAKALFAVGLLGASLLAGAVLPLATAYAVAEAFGQPKGVSLDFRRAPLFYGLFTALIIQGAALALVPNVPVIPLLVAVQVFNGALLPVILFFVLRLANDPRLMGALKNRWWENALGWGTAALVSGAVLVLFGSQLLSLFTGG